ncbi:MAG: Mur ligase family protein [Patescibacteria group bacterium]
MLNFTPMANAHFIGIAGVGMSATAVLLKEKGWDITGSDEGFYPPASTYLESQGIAYFGHHSPKNIPPDVDLIVIGKHAKLVPEDNEEVKAAIESGVPVKSFPEVLGEMTAETRNIVAAGSYGKSTTTAILSHVLLSSGRDISYFIGAIPKTPEKSSHAGKDNLFVLEGDEYPAANWDKTSKFLLLNPHDVLLTSLSHDHLNIFPTIEDYISPFHKLVELLPEDGLLVVCSEAPNVADFLKKIKRSYITYGLEAGADWYPENIKLGATSTFDLVHKGKKIISLSTSLLGTHNIENIVGASAMLLQKKLVSAEELKKGVAGFEALRRRLDLKSEKTSVRVYEGFGSSYGKAKSAIEAVRAHFKENRLVIVFEPHTFSWRNREALRWYEDIFEPADKVFIYKPPTHGATTHAQLSLSEILAEVKKTGVDVIGFEDKHQGLKLLEKEMQKDDVLLILTSGDMDGLIEEIISSAEKLFPKK